VVFCALELEYRLLLLLSSLPFDLRCSIWQFDACLSGMSIMTERYDANDFGQVDS